MKKIFAIAFTVGVLTACGNNASENETANDSLNAMDNSDPNNRNTTVYDSAARSGDTASYERMNQNRVGDSTSVHDTTRH
jgi:hypothetical protein